MDEEVEALPAEFNFFELIALIRQASIVMVRFKTRWLLLAIDDQPAASPSSSKGPSAASSLTPQVVTRLLRASLLLSFGDVAAGSFGGVLTCKYYSTHTGTAIVRCTRDGARLVWAAATLISSASELPSPGTPSNLRIRVVHCGGTIKKLQTKAIELDRRIILRLRTRQATQQSISFKETLMPSADTEDVGEALDTAAPALAAVSSTSKAVPHQDPETAALLATSKKEISSITM